MHIRLKLYATLVVFTPSNEPGVPFEVDLPNGSSLSDLINQLDIPEREAKVIFVNSRIQSPDYQLQDNDEVSIFPPIGGG